MGKFCEGHQSRRTLPTPLPVSETRNNVSTRATPCYPATSAGTPTIPLTAVTTASLSIKEKQNNFLPKSLNEAPNVKRRVPFSTRTSNVICASSD